MTTEQSNRCDDLARQIAELDPNWHANTLGVAYRHDAGMTFRRVSFGDEWAWVHSPAEVIEIETDWRNDMMCLLTNTPDPCVPDWRDEVTLACLFLALDAKERHLIIDFDGDTRAVVPKRKGLGKYHAEMILALRVAQLEVK